MKVITISGKAQNGKDTTAGLLKAALEADGYKVLIMLYFYHIPCFGRISTQDNCTIQRSKYALSGIGGDIRTVMFSVSIKFFCNHPSRGTIKYQSFYVRAGCNACQIILFCFFILFPELRFPLCAFHQRVFAYGSQ